MLHILTDVPDGLECALLHHLCAPLVGDVLHQGRYQPRPHAPGQLHHGDHLDALGGSTRPEALGPKSSQDVLLGGQSDILRHGQPPLLVLSPQTLVIGVEEVLQLDSCLLPAHRAVTSVVENIRESPAIDLLSTHPNIHTRLT